MAHTLLGAAHPATIRRSCVLPPLLVAAATLAVAGTVTGSGALFIAALVLALVQAAAERLQPWRTPETDARTAGAPSPDGGSASSLNALRTERQR